MFGDCHIHMILDGVYYRAAIDHQKEKPDEAIIRRRLSDYAARGITYLRDGGDAWGVGLWHHSLPKNTASPTAHRPSTSADKGITAVLSARGFLILWNTKHLSKRSKPWADTLSRSWCRG